MDSPSRPKPHQQHGKHAHQSDSGDRAIHLSRLHWCDAVPRLAGCCPVPAFARRVEATRLAWTAPAPDDPGAIRPDEAKSAQMDSPDLTLHLLTFPQSRGGSDCRTDIRLGFQEHARCDAGSNGLARCPSEVSQADPLTKTMSAVAQ